MKTQYATIVVLSALIDIKLKRNISLHCGICDNLKNKINTHNTDIFCFKRVGMWDAQHWLENSFQRFDLNWLFPVECHVSGFESISCARSAYDIQTNKFDESTEYGKFRLELLDRLIEKASNEIIIDE
ncbi:hypothetical protein POP12_026 [Pectobacterium phage POP12]|nr:hypothetical protein POP12_026 [Pectobacterium phage POP12]